MHRAVKANIYVFGWPSFLGGADTKLFHLLTLLNGNFQLTIVPNHPRFLAEKYWVRVLQSRGIKICLLENLPRSLNGYALALSNRRFFSEGIAQTAKESGLKVVWSSEMMWHHPGEVEAVREGLVDKALFVSELQKAFLSKGYGLIRSHIVGNYIDPEAFPFHEKADGPFTIGRLSRAAPEKYPEDFPVMYERLELPETRFRVMAWSNELREKYRWHHFDHRWDLLPAQAESQTQFLHSLDLFVYPLGHRFIEAWGRSAVEAMLSGAVTLLPSGHNFEHLIMDEVTGFLCSDFYEFKARAHELFLNRSLLVSMRRAARKHAEYELCNREAHLKIWKEVFE
jgi:hypothetical protein